MSPSRTASSNAVALMRQYFAVIDKLGQDREQPLARLATVTISTQLIAERTFLRNQRARDERQTGDTQVADLRVQAVNLDNSDPASGKVPTVLIDACWDVSNVDVLNKRGKSVLSSNRPDSGWTRYTVANYHWTKDPDRGWRIVSGQDLKQTPCTAS